MGMIGGGPGSFIGAVHRKAAALDGQIELVCGAFSSDAKKSAVAGTELYLPADRVYGSFEEMIAKEAALPAGQRMDFVSIVTPNHLHFAPAKMALEAGFDVMLDKPMTFDLEEAKTLQSVVAKTGHIFCLTHTYAGYPMIKEAKHQVNSGSLGKIRKVVVTYPQGWLYKQIETGDNKQATWRTDPAKSGAAGAMGDIGTHAFHLAEYITGLHVTAVCADVNIIVKGRRLDDDGAVLLHFDNGASGTLIASQVFSGEENNLSIQVYGDEGGLEWKHAHANTLLMKWPDKPAQLLRAGNDYLCAAARHNSRLPAGHPEGFIEAFANLYRNFALCVQAKKNRNNPKEEWLDFPGVEEGVRGMAFIKTVVESGRSERKWVELKM
jgi:predicted dehydrogenase